MLRDIVLVHGGGQGGWVWAETIAAIRLEAGDAAGRIFALDVPGCGEKRGADTNGLSIPDVIRIFAAELDALDVRDALLVGHSMAGTLLPGLAAARSDRIARAVYFTCSAPAQGQTIGQMMGQGKQGSNENEVGWPLDIEWPLDPENALFRQLFEAAFCDDMDKEMAPAFLDKLGKDRWPDACGRDWDSWHYEEARHVPATYVIALADKILPVTWQERFAARVNASRLVRIDSGHQGMNTRPFSLAEILIAEARIGAERTA
jgi:pimeloyl-ACP methyl ester carboxylesterase